MELIRPDEMRELRVPHVVLVDPKERHVYKPEPGVEIEYRRIAMAEAYEKELDTADGILGWKGITEKGKEVEFSRDRAMWMPNLAQIDDLVRASSPPTSRDSLRSPAEISMDNPSVIFYRRPAPAVMAQLKKENQVRGAISFEKLTPRLIHYMVVGWENVTDIDGEQVVFSEELIDRLPMDTVEILSELAVRIARGLSREEEDRSKNSTPTSGD